MSQVDRLLHAAYETSTVSLESRVPEDVSVVILTNVENISSTQEFWIDQFLMNGGGLVILADGSQIRGPTSMFSKDLQFHLQPGNDRLPASFLAHYGITINDDVVLDLSCISVCLPGEQRPTKYPCFPLAKAVTINQTNALSSGFHDLLFAWPSSITLSPKPGATAVDLVRSSDHATHVAESMTLDRESIMANQKSKEFQSQFTLIGMLEGEFDSYYELNPIPPEISTDKSVGSNSGNRESKPGSDH